jgi:uncharacterized membrane protein
MRWQESSWRLKIGVAQRAAEVWSPFLRPAVSASRRTRYPLPLALATGLFAVLTENGACKLFQVWSDCRFLFLKTLEIAMRIGRVVMGVLYVVAGVAHFVLTRMYEGIVPDYFPAHRAMVLVSGAAEVAGGVGVLLPRSMLSVRRAAAWGIVALLIAVMPANVWMLHHPERYPGVPVWAMWVRLPVQLVLMWWAHRYTRPDTTTGDALLGC